jgi:hypothetical protein
MSKKVTKRNRLANEYAVDGLPEGSVRSEDIEGDLERVITLTLSRDYVLYSKVQVESDEEEQEDDESAGTFVYERGHAYCNTIGAFAWVPKY